ncbi:hypothetical protein H6G06_06855 [Anabaena sphaerica FACHB-251]|uniref:Uncharacterized protein n=1 Tax=Anabaena sphaerica FACHB-251 TaxID=2692883 RepID=A0A927A068_9NOST|nr:hypothetical protein [Anabaena sphaerica]MBD2293211.1 hypothetical protein [Anabaena sphaerica FACHB-251]
MFLYHGTSFENVERIRSKGVLPPRETKKSNWSMPESNDFESRNDAVYLSEAYSPYYAFTQYYKRLYSFNLKQTSNELTTVSSKLALIEIDIDSLEKDKLYPDEDFLVQSNLPCKIGETLKERTKYFKENLESYQDYLKDSLQKIGNCCYIDLIPPTAISRITKWCWNDVKILRWWNYDYISDKGGVTIFKDQDQSQLYRLLTRCFAKREFQPDELLSLLEKELQVNNIANYEFSEYLRKLDQNAYFENYKSWKDALIQEMQNIHIYDKNKGISTVN